MIGGIFVYLLSTQAGSEDSGSGHIFLIVVIMTWIVTTCIRLFATKLSLKKIEEQIDLNAKLALCKSMVLLEIVLME